MINRELKSVTGRTPPSPPLIIIRKVIIYKINSFCMLLPVSQTPQGLEHVNCVWWSIIQIPSELSAKCNIFMIYGMEWNVTFLPEGSSLLNWIVSNSVPLLVTVLTWGFLWLNSYSRKWIADLQTDIKKKNVTSTNVSSRSCLLSFPFFPLQIQPFCQQFKYTNRMKIQTEL